MTGLWNDQVVENLEGRIKSGNFTQADMVELMEEFKAARAKLSMSWRRLMVHHGTILPHIPHEAMAMQMYQLFETYGKKPEKVGEPE